MSFTCSLRRFIVERPLILLGGGFLALFGLYLGASQFVANSADNASIILEGQAMAQFQFFLVGWSLPPDSFITTEIPIYALAFALLQTTAPLLKVVPAFLYAATVFGATAITGWRAKPQERCIAIGVCLALLAFPVGVMYERVFQGPMHIATIGLSLASFVAYDRFVRGVTPRASLLLFLGLTIWNIIGDPLAELLIPVPIALVAGWYLVRTRGRDRTSWIVLGAASASFLLGYGFRAVWIALGTNIGASDITFTNWEGFWQNIQWAFFGIATFFHISLGATTLWDPRNILSAINCVVLGAFLYGLGRLAWEHLQKPTIRESFTLVLLTAIVGDFGVFLITTYPTDVYAIRYLFPAFVYAAILGYPALQHVVPRQRLKRGTGVILALHLVTFVGTLAMTPMPMVQQQPVVTFLRTHHLTNGLGTFWTSADVTVLSNDQVHVRQIYVEDGKIHGYFWHANDAWFEPDALKAVNFVLLQARDDGAAYYQAANVAFGPPDHVYRIDQYVILAWDRPIIDTSFRF